LLLACGAGTRFLVAQTCPAGALVHGRCDEDSFSADALADVAQGNGLMQAKPPQGTQQRVSFSGVAGGGSAVLATDSAAFDDAAPAQGSSFMQASLWNQAVMAAEQMVTSLGPIDPSRSADVATAAARLGAASYEPLEQDHATRVAASAAAISLAQGVSAGSKLGPQPPPIERMDAHGLEPDEEAAAKPVASSNALVQRGLANGPIDASGGSYGVDRQLQTIVLVAMCSILVVMVASSVIFIASSGRHCEEKQKAFETNIEENVPLKDASAP